MNVPINQATFFLRSLISQLTSGTLTMYSGVMPVTPETAVTGGNTALATWTFGGSNALFSTTPGGGYVTALCQFSSDVATPVATGVATFARATFNPIVWGIGTHHFLRQVKSNAGNLYVCIVDGVGGGTGSPGPTGTGDSIQDNLAYWAYIGPSGGTNTVFGDFTVGTTGADVIIANTSITPSTNVTITSFSIRTPAT